MFNSGSRLGSLHTSTYREPSRIVIKKIREGGVICAPRAKHGIALNSLSQYN